MEWRSMDYAPKDSGKKIIGWVGGEPRFIKWTKASHVPNWGWCLVDQGVEDCDLCEPMAWMWPPVTPPFDYARMLAQIERLQLELAALRDQRDNLLGIVDALEDREMGDFDSKAEDDD